MVRPSQALAEDWDGDGDGTVERGSMGDAMTLVLPAIAILVVTGVWQAVVAVRRKFDVGQYF